jgi:hypothetical protein
MRRISLLVALAACLVAATPASSAEQRRIASYCSESGDVCFGIYDNAQHVIRFELVTFTKYFGRYRICVSPPRATATCKIFRVRQMGAEYGGKVFWQRSFPNKGAGRYRVTWKVGAQRLGPTLTFRAPRPGV